MTHAMRNEVVEAFSSDLVDESRPPSDGTHIYAINTSEGMSETGSNEEKTGKSLPKRPSGAT